MNAFRGTSVIWISQYTPMNAFILHVRFNRDDTHEQPWYESVRILLWMRSYAYSLYISVRILLWMHPPFMWESVGMINMNSPDINQWRYSYECVHRHVPYMNKSGYSHEGVSSLLTWCIYIIIYIHTYIHTYIYIYVYVYRFIYIDI